MKIVINKCCGGFGLSDKALEMYNMLANTNLEHAYDLDRNDPILVHVVETLGDDADGKFARLRIVEIPDDINWEIAEYDGVESVEEVHRSWS